MRPGVCKCFLGDTKNSSELSQPKHFVKNTLQLCSCGHSYIGQTQINLKFHLDDEHNPVKSKHQTTDVVKHSYTYPGHFMHFKNPEVLASACNYRKLLIKETLLIQEQQLEINVDNFTTP